MASELTPEAIAEMRRLLALNPEPWAYQQNPYGTYDITETSAAGWALSFDETEPLEEGSPPTKVALAIAAVNALPALLDMAERCAKAEAELARHRAEAERFDSEDWTYDWGDA